MFPWLFVHNLIIKQNDLFTGISHNAWYTKKQNRESDQQTAIKEVA